MMELQKILLIDGLSTIMNEKYFVRDDIPRILANYLEEEYTIWIASRTSEDISRWFDKDVVPDWMRENILLQTDLEFENVPNIADQKKSMVLTNDLKNPSIYNICGKVKSIDELFQMISFPKLDKSDFLFCFGFDSSSFILFCQTNNLIGIRKDEVVQNSSVGVTPNGMAFFIESDEPVQDSIQRFQLYSELAIEQNRFIPKRKRTLLGVVYQGKEKELAKLYSIPLLYV